jgi:Fe-S oxidoreductase
MTIGGYQDSPLPTGTQTAAGLKMTGDMAKNCVHCNQCVTECAFLQRHGTPGQIARAALATAPGHDSPAFECSLCDMCAAVCPLSLKPSGMFLEMRGQAGCQGRSEQVSPCFYLGYEKRGVSRHLTYYALPGGCNTILFPGCAMSATRPQAILDLFAWLRKKEPTLGMVLDCCTKPSHDLGRMAFFENAFGEMRRYLLANGVRRVLTACPSCFKMFKTHGGDLAVETVYETLAAETNPSRIRHRKTVTIHDPCPFRFDAPVQSAVRTLVSRKGFAIEEMPHHGATTFCCGEGASVRCSAPELAETWSRRRVDENRENQMITYCAGCNETLGRYTDTLHVLDLLFPDRHAAGHRRPAPVFPRTCWNRLRLKHTIKNSVPSAVSRERVVIHDRMVGATLKSAQWWSYLISRLAAFVFSILVRFAYRSGASTPRR